MDKLKRFSMWVNETNSYKVWVDAADENSALKQVQDTIDNGLFEETFQPKLKGAELELDEYSIDEIDEQGFVVSKDTGAKEGLI